MATPEMARNTRRSAQLFHAWDRNDSDALVALIDEAEACEETLLNVVSGLLYVGSNLVKAAANGDYDTYLEQLTGASLVAELQIGEDQ